MEEGKLTMFGKTYNTVGNTDSNFLIRTKGDLKVQWGGKFIDVIKNGKLASADKGILKTVSSSDDISDNGIYLITREEGNEVWVSIDGTRVNISEEVGTTYVSFLTKQKEITADQKYTALTNAGFYYETLEDAQEAGVKAGIIFIAGENKLYVAKRGQLIEYASADSSEEQNTYFDEITIKDLEILENGSDMTISSPSLLVEINKQRAILVGDQTRFYLNLTMAPNTFIQSDNASQNAGYRLYTQSNVSILEIDKIIVRDSIELPSKYIEVTVNQFRTLIEQEQLEPDQQYRLYDFKNFWELTEAFEARPLIVTARTKNSYYTDQCFFQEDLQCVVSYDVSYNSEYVINGETVQSLGLITRMKDANNNECNYNFKHLQFYIDGNWVYTFQGKLAAYSGNIVELGNIRVETNIDGVPIVLEDGDGQATFTTPCHKNIFSQQGTPIHIGEDFNENTCIKTWNPIAYYKVKECLFKDEVFKTIFNSPLVGCTFEYPVSDTNLFFDTTLTFKNCQFLEPVMGEVSPIDTHTRELLQSDEPKQITFQVVNGVQKLVVLSNSILAIPSGSIIMWHGTEIPYGWAICDGENGTPNLVGKFIKAVAVTEQVGEVSSELNDNNELTILQENLPKHSHPHSAHIHNIEGTISGTTDSSGELEAVFKQDNYNYGIESDSKIVVTSVTDAEVTNSTVQSVANIQAQGGTTVGGSHTHYFSTNVEDSLITSATTSTEQVLPNSEWPNKPIKIEPRSYALVFIMKL